MQEIHPGKPRELHRTTQKRRIHLDTFNENGYDSGRPASARRPITHSTQGGIARKPVASALFVLGLVAALGPGTAGRVEAAPVTHTDLKTQLNSIKTKVNGIQTQAGALQTTVDGIQTQLDQIPPAWSQTLPAVERFVLVLGAAAVLDKETGLVWEQAPDATSRNWFSAQASCNRRAVGGRKGWRLPVVQELASLVDPSISPGPTLPAGHPFTNVQSSSYWSATTLASNTSAAWAVSLSVGLLDIVDKGDVNFVWCVRGGHGGPDAQ